jgi:hypothetical protein
MAKPATTFVEVMEVLRVLDMMEKACLRPRGEFRSHRRSREPAGGCVWPFKASARACAKSACL